MRRAGPQGRKNARPGHVPPFLKDDQTQRDKWDGFFRGVFSPIFFRAPLCTARHNMWAHQPGLRLEESRAGVVFCVKFSGLKMWLHLSACAIAALTSYGACSAHVTLVEMTSCHHIRSTLTHRHVGQLLRLITEDIYCQVFEFTRGSCSSLPQAPHIPNYIQSMYKESCSSICASVQRRRIPPPPITRTRSIN